MNFEISWGINVSFPWLEKLHDFVWQEDDDDDE